MRKNALKYWLDLGVDGFNLADASHIFEDYLLRNETKPVSFSNLYFFCKKLKKILFTSTNIHKTNEKHFY